LVKRFLGKSDWVGTSGGGEAGGGEEVLGWIEAVWGNSGDVEVD